MKAMLLCAGLGERLLPLTAELPKPAFPVANRPLVWYSLRLLQSWGVDRVMVNAHHLPEILEAAVRDSCPEGMAVDFSFEEEILGTGGGLRKVLDWFDVDPFIIMNGDILTDVEIAGALELHRSRGAVATMVISTNGDYRSLGEIEVDGGARVRSIAGRPGGAGGDLLPAFFTGIHVMSGEILDYIPDRRRSCLARDCYRPLVEEGGGVFGFIMDAYWRDIGTPVAYLDANLDVLNGRYRPPFDLAGEPCKVSVPGMKSPSLIGRGAALGRDVVIGPYGVVGEGAVIGDRCTVRESVVWPGAAVPAGSDLARAIVGRTTSVKLL